MCEEVINECRLKKVYYFLNQNKIINNTIHFIKLEDTNMYFFKEIKEFFKDKR